MDESVLVRHPQGTGYSTHEAHQLMVEFWNRLPAHYAVYQRLINTYAKRRGSRSLKAKLGRHLRWLMRLGRN